MPQDARRSQQNEPDGCNFHRLAQAAMGAIPSAMSDPINDRFQGETALVLFSGGQDSATCLAWSLQRFARVETLGFHYGQRHAIELECRAELLAGMKSQKPDWAARLGEGHTLEIPTLGGHFRHRADPRRRHRDGRRRPAQYIRARPQSGLSDLCGGAGLPARHYPYRRRHVRNRLFRLSGLPRRDHQGVADRRSVSGWRGPSSCTRR